MTTTLFVKEILITPLKGQRGWSKGSRRKPTTGDDALVQTLVLSLTYPFSTFLPRHVRRGERISNGHSGDRL